MEKIIHDEEVVLDSKRLRAFQKQILNTDRKNTCKEIKQRVNEYIHKNNLSQEVIDNFNSFLKDCERYYINK